MRTYNLETADGGSCETTEKSDQARETHILETTERGACQDTESNRLSKAHSRPGDDRGRDLLGHIKKPIE